jgi:hypothetical protein
MAMGPVCSNSSSKLLKTYLRFNAARSACGRRLASVECGEPAMTGSGLRPPQPAHRRVRVLRLSLG